MGSPPVSDADSSHTCRKKKKKKTQQGSELKRSCWAANFVVKKFCVP